MEPVEGEGIARCDGRAVDVVGPADMALLQAAVGRAQHAGHRGGLVQAGGMVCIAEITVNALAREVDRAVLRLSWRPAGEEPVAEQPPAEWSAPDAHPPAEDAPEEVTAEVEPDDAEEWPAEQAPAEARATVEEPRVTPTAPTEGLSVAPVPDAPATKRQRWYHILVHKDARGWTLTNAEAS